MNSQYSGTSVTAGSENIAFGMGSHTGFALEASGSLTLTPISATVAFHAGNERIDPYVGAGAVWVMTGDLRSGDLSAHAGAVARGDVKFKTTTIGAGLQWKF